VGGAGEVVQEAGRAEHQRACYAGRPLLPVLSRLMLCCAMCTSRSRSTLYICTCRRRGALDRPGPWAGQHQKRKNLQLGHPATSAMRGRPLAHLRQSSLTPAEETTFGRTWGGFCGRLLVDRGCSFIASECLHGEVITTPVPYRPWPLCPERPLLST
jgi:hypothetical protein